MSQKIQADITKIGIKLLLEEPFYGHLFSSLLRETNLKTDSISISILENKPTLIVNPRFWENLQINNEKHAYLKHQLLHLALKHPFRRNEFHHKHIFDIAADLVVNQYINPMHLPLDAITLDKYPKLKKLEKGKDVGFYYRKILEINDKNNSPDNSLPDENNKQIRQHQDWNAFEQVSRMDQRMIENLIEDSLVQAAERSDDKLKGSLPGSLYRMIQEKLNHGKKQMDWKRVLRLFVGTGRKTFIKNTIRKPSKRYGTSPGIQIKQRQKILVALDTSGSITTDEISTFFSELIHIKRQNAEIMIVECDAKIQRAYVFNKQFPKEIKGAGGTNFNPVIHYANEEYLPNAIIYFTDGFGSVPDISPRFPILWLISKDGIKEEDLTWKKLPGRKVKMS